MSILAEVGATAGAAPAVESPALLEQQVIEKDVALFRDYTILLRAHSDLGSLASTTSELEAKMATVQSDIQTLHNQVAGNAFSAPSLLETEATKVGSQSAGSSLESRIVALEHEVENARSQVTSIEQVVVG